MEGGGDKVAVALVSGGIDSPVAVARMVQSGWTIHSMHCSQEPITGREAEEKTLGTLSLLANPNGPLAENGGKICDKLTVIPVGETLAMFTASESHRDYFVHMKRLFNVLGCMVADEVGATHLLTGENLGQVSSQTLGNLGAVEKSSNRPILRPLLGLDKQEIIDEARTLGTFDVSKGPELCDALGPKHPTTVANIVRLEANEENLGGLTNLAEKCYSQRREEPLLQ
jgi:thiamine biosynthesis protein ThiI|tara:strand:- start:258 stop:938 length:681 start_codon:yes stop_codon:yes gene_type:complete